jgi:4-amino-4-deoxy-L-arabinose transferase-like glycosyltransferase
MRDRVAIVLSAATAALHLAVANRYDLFRDELYFIVCGQHPQFGYADQPPLVPLLAAAGYAAGEQTWIVRLPAVAAAAALVWFVVAFVRLLGGGNGAAWVAGIAAATAPVLMGLTATLNTTTFEPLAWTLVAYALARAALLDDRRALVWGGAVAGVAMEAKYAIPLWLIALFAGIVAAGPRELLRRRELWLGITLAALIALPSVLWQAAHGWPFAELVHNAGLKDVATPPLAFAINQIVVLNPLFAPLWIAGLCAPFALRDLRALRFVPLACAIVAVAIVAGRGKDYYLAPIYPVLFALGSVALARAVRPAFTPALAAYVAVAVALSAIAAPVALPILDPPQLGAYMRALHLQPQAQERSDTTATLPPAFQDMLGWHTFVAQVARAYARIPAGERPRTSILVGNYGEAAAIDLYGPAYGLPPALSGHNQYGLWGERGQTPRNLLRVQHDPANLAPYCRRMHVLDTTSATYARDFENGQAIAFCGGLHPALGTLWPEVRFLE